MSIVPVSDQERSVSNSNNSTQDLWDPLASDLSNWDPFSDFRFPSPLHSLSTFFSPHYSPFGASVNTRLDWRETPRAHVLKLSVPNEDVLVELQDDRVLQVSVESGNFMSRFKIPDNGFIEQLKASMHNGVLTVIVPKVEASTSRPNIRVIDISG
ncbi:17.5 kDa class I heat shock protein-like [Quercus robur]|uniref:17.5 kDa class I heat shock protein-like n=1 Tax=Quercus robur TaxID=38942 RepID=UPI0021628B5C|nr:17.5 kDa class I heat shock protein-like [Quercus robur]